MAEFGIGIGAFADGFMRGVGLGKQLKGIRKENAADQAREEAVKSADAAREAAIEEQTKKLMEIGAPSTEQPAGSQAQAFPVGESGAPQQPASSTQSAAPVKPAGELGLGSTPSAGRDQARKKAEEMVGDWKDEKEAAVYSKMRDFYFSQGDLEKAAEFDKYMETREARKQVTGFTKALQAATVGDHAGVIKNITPVLEANYGNGFKIQGTSPVKDKDGNITGYNFEIRNTRTGEVTQNNLTNENLYQYALTIGSPQQGFERWLADRQSKDAAREKAQAEVGKTRMQLEKEVALENVRQGGRIELEGVKTRNQGNKKQQEIDAAVAALKQANYSDEFIRNALPGILGIDQYKRATSPEEARRLAFSDRMKNDFQFSRMAPEKQREIIEKDMALIYGGMSPTSAPSGGAPAQPGAASSNPAARGLPVLDRKTGQVIYR